MDAKERLAKAQREWARALSTNNDDLVDRAEVEMEAAMDQAMSECEHCGETGEGEAPFAGYDKGVCPRCNGTGKAHDGNRTITGPQEMVVRLRASFRGSPRHIFNDAADLIEQQANEIERLRAENERLRRYEGLPHPSEHAWQSELP